ncbi:hypothetical protein PITCH_A190002 [uncultured Desulfobacterium sp.]|uniref:DNA 3'-5' helicase n=1 Tax=uncultured Desulfobacterium sp. TaxID=201089 RepID=A0A445MVC0_9BACT|nr:hypothetical protein PITCH_A190002 [uncultured Desulfobacterium sp.]
MHIPILLELTWCNVVANHRVRYFLPSQVRGVYRFDETFSQVDASSYNQFAENKLRFLPCSLIDPIRCCMDLEEDFDSVREQVFLDMIPRDTNSRRARYFFNGHKYFHNVLHGTVDGADNYLEVQFVKKILAPLLNETGLGAFQPQKQIGPYFVDFALDGPTKLALEIDGFGKFSQRQDLDNFIERQNYITCQGWKIIRFTYGQIMHSTKATLRVLRDIFSADPYYQKFLVPGLAASGQPRQANLFDIFRTPVPKRLNVFDLVNAFYHVQDWFAQLAIENPTYEIFLRDELDFPFPLVALALSSLYSFLDAVSKIVDVKFDLPTVKVVAPRMANAWRDYLHPAISVTRRKLLSDVIAVCRNSIMNFSAFIPSPPRSEERLSFRNGLSFEEIHQHLDYITREVFGYNDGTNRFQDKVLKRIFDGKETLGISTTGSGKSFCFWLPALLKPGLTIVIAPLRSLMRDQRLTLLNYGISSMEFINSDIKNHVDQRRFLEEAKLGYLRLLYISPERLRIKKFVDELENLQKFVPINILAIDEAHCISEWGHDFRPSYLKIPSMRMSMAEKNPGLRLLALTATAGQQVEKDMRSILKLSETDVEREPMADRERFSYQIIPVTENNSKTAVFHKVLEKDLSTALKQESLSALLDHRNSRQEKAVGVVFCIYADPHGKNTVQDGISHYLFETMDVLEPDRVFNSRRGRPIYPKYNLDGFSDGRTRAFSSKHPTLCPHCHSYAYTSCGNRAVEEDDLDILDNNEPVAPAAGMKICQRCGHEFQGDKALSLKPRQWETLTKRNQNDFKDSRLDILVATKGFGMGIDKSSVRFVIHTSLSSGIESWYQEVGRAGRDNERAHIVLLADPPNDACQSELANSILKRPQCNWTGGCNHGRQSICDYGKQHLFITRSYPGAEADAIYALRMLDWLLSTYGQTGNNLIQLRFHFNDEISRRELALHRLLTLGLIEDYTISYGRPPHFEVILGFDSLPDSTEELEGLENLMEASLYDNIRHWDEAGKTQQTLTGVREEYRPLSDFAAKIQTFLIMSKRDPLSVQYRFFNIVYDHLLLLLDHTYKEVVTMRYDMLWNLCGVVNSAQDNKCQRVRVLPHFEGTESVDEAYRCGCCNVCSPELNFPDRVTPRPQNVSVERSMIELNELLQNNFLDIVKLRKLCEVFQDYRTATYSKGRAVLEGNPHNLPALYITREFSPPAELAANTKRFLRTANERRVSFGQLKELYKSSASKLKSDLLLLLNEQNTVCDRPEGWKFLFEEADMLDSGNEQLVALRDCLNFLLLVEELPSETESPRKKVLLMEEMINA